MNQHFLYTLIAYISWGLLPLYWKALRHVPAKEILCNRVLWSAFFLFLIIVFLKRAGDLKKVFQNKKKIVAVISCGLLVSLNWFVYIKAVNDGNIIATSMGYYINPLFSILLGVVFLKEKLNNAEKVSIVFALSGILYTAWHYGTIPVISIVLASTFSIYGLIKKKNNIDSIISLAAETLIIMPVFAAIYFHIIKNEQVFIFNNMKIFLLLAGSGAITAIPLFLFGKGVKGIRLSTAGFLQYIAPSIALLIGIFIYDENFKKTEVISFGLIWTGLLIYSVSSVLKFRPQE